MTCANPNCGTAYCYMCGKARLVADGASANGWGLVYYIFSNIFCFVGVLLYPHYIGTSLCWRV